MAIVKKMIDKMGGTISVTSEVGKGSTFVVELPFEMGAAPEKSKKEEADKENSIHGLNLMLVEDNELNREIATAIMKEIGLEVDTAEDGTDAVNIMSSAEGRKYDLIFMDAAKGQYIHFLPEILRLMQKGGLLVSDNVFKEGEILESRFAVKRRDRTIHKRMREYLQALSDNPELQTLLLEEGDGAALCIRK